MGGVNQTNPASNVNFKQPIEKVSKKLNKKLLIIIIISVLGFYLIINIGARFYFTNQAHEMVTEVLLSTINEGIDNLKHQDLEPSENISELNQRIFENENYILNQVNDLRINGEMKVINQGRTYYCDDGSIEEYHPNKDPCYGGHINNSENGDFKEFIINGSYSITILASESLLITMTKYPIYILENLEESKKTMDNIISNTFDMLFYLAKKITLWQSIQPVVRDSISNETGDVIEVDVKQYITNLEEFDNTMNAPTEQEINNLDFEEDCIKTFREFDKKSQYAQGLKTSIWQKMLFMRYKVPKICKTLVNYQKQNAIKILKSIENEENPFESIEKKLYLNLMVECDDEWLPLSENKECHDNYLENFEKEFVSKLK